jgi:hypothetical protein
VAGDELSAFYRDLFDRLMTGSGGERHFGDCNTPDRFRLFSNRFEPLSEAPDNRPLAVLVVTSLIEEAPIGERYWLARPDERRYRQPTSLILQCGGCRRVQVAGTAPRLWELVPEYVANPPSNVSHGLCELCREVRYGSHVRAVS